MMSAIFGDKVTVQKENMVGFDILPTFNQITAITPAAQLLTLAWYYIKLLQKSYNLTIYSICQYNFSVTLCMCHSDSPPNFITFLARQLFISLQKRSKSIILLVLLLIAFLILPTSYRLPLTASLLQSVTATQQKRKKRGIVCFFHGPIKQKYFL